jgi:hypothetical protein
MNSSAEGGFDEEPPGEEDFPCQTCIGKVCAAIGADGTAEMQPWPKEMIP